MCFLRNIIFLLIYSISTLVFMTLVIKTAGWKHTLWYSNSSIAASMKSESPPLLHPSTVMTVLTAWGLFALWKKEKESDTFNLLWVTSMNCECSVCTFTWAHEGDSLHMFSLSARYEMCWNFRHAKCWFIGMQWEQIASRNIGVRIKNMTSKTKCRPWG